jgi:hypothetical protein
MNGLFIKASGAYNYTAVKQKLIKNGKFGG